MGNRRSRPQARCPHRTETRRTDLRSARPRVQIQVPRLGRLSSASIVLSTVFLRCSRPKDRVSSQRTRTRQRRSALVGRQAIIWLDREGHWGGLHAEIERMAMDLASRGSSVAVIGSCGLTLDRPGIVVVPPGEPLSVLSDSVAEIVRIATPTSVLYVGRLAPGMEAQHLLALSRLPPMQRGWIRCPTTQDARTLRRVFSRLPSWSPSFRWSVHVLNLRSAQYVRPLLRRFGVDAVLIENSSYGQGPTATGLDPVSVFHFSGRAAESKNVLALLRAWSVTAGESSATASYANLRVHTLPGPLAATVANLAETIEGVEMCGPYPRDTPPFKFGEFLIVPSFREGHPNVLVEAMSRGAIVIGTKIPGVEEHVSASGGVLIDRPFSSPNIGRALLSALRFSARTRRERSYQSLVYSRRWCHSLSSGAQAVTSSWDQPRTEYEKGSARR